MDYFSEIKNALLDLTQKHRSVLDYYLVIEEKNSGFIGLPGEPGRLPIIGVYYHTDITGTMYFKIAIPLSDRYSGEFTSEYNYFTESATAEKFKVYHSDDPDVVIAVHNDNTHNIETVAQLISDSMLAVGYGTDCKLGFSGFIHNVGNRLDSLRFKDGMKAAPKITAAINKIKELLANESDPYCSYILTAYNKTLDNESKSIDVFFDIESISMDYQYPASQIYERLECDNMNPNMRLANCTLETLNDDGYFLNFNLPYCNDNLKIIGLFITDYILFNYPDIPLEKIGVEVFSSETEQLLDIPCCSD